jgi:hypothetical protein
VALLNRRQIAGTLAGVLWMVRLAGAARAEGSGPLPEDQVKAAFLFNFLKFIEWPDKASQEPWVICVVGRGDFANLLEQTVGDRTVNGRKVMVRRFRHAADVHAGDGKDCHLLYLPAGESEAGAVPARPGLLTVGDSPVFIESGGVIRLYVEASKVRFEIRPDAGHAAGLRISAQLMKLGTVR